MSGKLPSKTRTAQLLRSFIRTPRTTSPWLSRKLVTNKGSGHRLGSPRLLHLVTSCRCSRLYTTSSLAWTESSTYSGGSSVNQTSDLVPSDAQRRTIYALSTPPGKAGVAVIRISGPHALDVWKGMVRTRALGKGKAREHGPEPWKMHRCSIVHPKSEEVLDDGLAVFFKGTLMLPFAIICTIP